MQGPPGDAPGPNLEANSFSAKRKGVAHEGADVSKAGILSYGLGMERRRRGHWGPNHGGGASCVTPRAVGSPELSCLSMVRGYWDAELGAGRPAEKDDCS